ncbi:hypothetical protein BH11MYX1_BH11MYX1_47660 [soil metagenome]
MKLLTPIVWLLACAAVQAVHAAPARAPLTPEHQKFVKEMAASYDQLVASGVKAEGYEQKHDYSNAAASWLYVKKGAEALDRNAAIAARVGSFREPMRFITKVGTLTPKQYLVKMRTLAAKAEVRNATDLAALYASRDKQAKRGFVETGAMQLAMIEASAKRAAAITKAKPVDATHLVASTLSVATELRKLVAGAVKTKRVDASASYPMKPTALTSAQMMGRLDKAIAALEQQSRTLAKLVAKATPAPKRATTQPGTAPSAPSRPTQPTESTEPTEPTESTDAVSYANPTPADTTSTAVADPDVGPVGLIPGETCNEAYSLSCDAFNRPCCPGLQCLADEYTHDWADPPYYTPSVFKCMEPLNAPPNPNHPFN